MCVILQDLIESFCVYDEILLESICGQLLQTCFPMKFEFADTLKMADMQTIEVYNAKTNDYAAMINGSRKKEEVRKTFEKLFADQMKVGARVLDYGYVYYIFFP